MGFLQFLPELWVAISFLQCGTWMVFMLYSFNMSPPFYSITSVGPQVMACVGAVGAGLLLTLMRMWKGRMVFLHFFLILSGSIVFLVVAILSVVDSDGGEVYSSALMIGGFCHGMIYVAGMCYVHIRAGDFRVQRVAVLHIFYLFGVATTAHSIHEYNEYYATPRDDGLWEHANLPIAYHFFAFSGTAVIVLIVHLLLQGRCYDSRKILDSQLDKANGKFDNFKSTLTAPIRQAIAPKMDTWNQLKVTKLMLTAKVKGGLVFNNLLIGLVFYAQRYLFTGEDDQFSYIVHYITLVGLLFGFGASFFIQLKWIFIPSTFGYCILLIIAMSLYTGASYIGATVFMWLFYIIIGVSYFIPDVGLMEVAPLPYYDSLLAIGYCFEAVPLMIATFMVNQYFPISTGSLWVAGSICMVGLILAAIGMIFWYPDTLRKKVIDIQYMLLYPDKIIHIRREPPKDNCTVDLDPAPPVPYPTIEATPPSPTPMPIPPPVPYPEVQDQKFTYPDPPTVQVVQPAAHHSNGSALHPNDEQYSTPRAAVIETSVEYRDMSSEKV